MNKNVPLLFSFPVWKGKIKRRIAKKILRRQKLIFSLLKKGNYTNFKIGDVINDCSGFNGVIKEAYPVYFPAFGGYVLVDVDLYTTNTGCSLTHCGIEPQISQEEIERRLLSYYQKWIDSGHAATGYEGLKNSQIQHLMKKYDALKKGDHITDSNGFLLKEFSLR